MECRGQDSCMPSAAASLTTPHPFLFFLIYFPHPSTNPHTSPSLIFSSPPPSLTLSLSLSPSCLFFFSLLTPCYSCFPTEANWSPPTQPTYKPPPTHTYAHTHTSMLSRMSGTRAPRMRAGESRPEEPMASDTCYRCSFARLLTPLMLTSDRTKRKTPF